MKHQTTGWLFVFLLVSAVCAVIPQYSSDLICSPEDPTDCYPVEFVPTQEWQPIREGQVIPQGLDIRLDWQTGEKFAKLGDGVQEEEVPVNEVIVKEIEEVDDNKVVHYDENDHETDKEIEALKMVVQNSETHMELDDALELITLGKYENNEQLVSALDALTEHSHDLSDGVAISETGVMNQLLTFALSTKFDNKVKELSLRVIAQSLRHNPEAVANVDIHQVLPSLLSGLSTQKDGVIQKRLLGVISSLIQNRDNAYEFFQMNGHHALVDSFDGLQPDSQVRTLEILEDLKTHSLQKREDDSEFETKLFNTVQESLAKGQVADDYVLESIFDKLVELKKSNKSLKASQNFLAWLSQEGETRKLAKRDGETDDDLRKKLVDARHLVFGNPMGHRKAYADEL